MREIHFLLNHKEFFVNHVSACLALTPDFLENYDEILDWNYLSRNQKLPWSIEFIKEFDEYWNWDYLSGNESLPWSEELILKHAERWKIKATESQNDTCLLYNNSIMWSKKLVYKFADQMCGTWLAQRTELLNDHPEILEDFKEVLWWEYVSGNEYMNWSEELIDKFITYWDWDCLSANEAIVWSKELKEKYKDRFNQYYHDNHCTGRYAHTRRKTDFDLSEEEDKSVKVLYTLEEFEKVRRLNSPGRMSLDERVP